MIDPHLLDRMDATLRELEAIHGRLRDELRDDPSPAGRLTSAEHWTRLAVPLLRGARHDLDCLLRAGRERP